MEGDIQTCGHSLSILLNLTLFRGTSRIMNNFWAQCFNLFQSRTFLSSGYRCCRPKGRNPAQEMAAFRRNPVILLSNIMEKAAGNCCLFVKTCAFSYTHRLDKIYQRMLSIFDRNITFLVHIYTRKICL